MQDCKFISIKYLPAVRQNSNKTKKKKELSAKVYVDLIVNGKTKQYEISKKVQNYFHKDYVSKSMVDAFCQKIRINQVVFKLEKGNLIIRQSHL